jgi:hypothetical protein
MHHHTDPHIRVHVFCCVLALMTAHLMRRQAARAGLHELLRRRTGLGSLNGSLHRLRCAATVDDLVARVPHEVVMLGFNRALFSWVEQGHWMPQAAYTRSGPDEARAMMDAGAPPYWHVRDLLEAEMIRSRSPVVVRQALKNPRVHPELLSVTHSHSYVAARWWRKAMLSASCTRTRTSTLAPSTTSTGICSRCSAKV